MAPGITIYCDNNGIIDRVHRLAKTTPITPRSTTDDDYDVYQAIHTAINEVKPVTITLRHIKGHQDQQPNKKYLSLPARLNIECDQRAAAYLKIARKLRPKKNPPIPDSYPLLIIDGNIIVRDLQANLRFAATTPDYRDYIHKKLNWTTKDCKNVNWLSIKLAIRQFNQPDRQRLQKFLHDWLPLCGAVHSQQLAQDSTCLLC